jgi:small subunit ribosomal protein S1
MPTKKTKSKKNSKKTDLNPLVSEFQAYLDESDNLPKKISSGDIVKGRVVDVKPNSILVDVGYKSEGIIAGRELKTDGNDAEEMKLGDEILVYVVTPEDDEGQLVLSLRRTQSAKQWIDL